MKIAEGLINALVPPRCEKHNETMVLYFYARPGGVMGNGWVCDSCKEDRASQQTRFPEDAEL